MTNNELTFGEFLTEKRKANGISLRGLAEKLGLSPVYLCDIEKGRKSSPLPDTLSKISAILHLSKEDKDFMYDLAGKSKNSVPPDLPEYIMEKDIVKTALRTAKDLKATDEDWADFIKRISKK